MKLVGAPNGGRTRLSRRGDDFLEAVGERLLVLNIRGHFHNRNRGRAYCDRGRCEFRRAHSHVINDPRQAKPVHGPARIFFDSGICALEDAADIGAD